MTETIQTTRCTRSDDGNTGCIKAEGHPGRCKVREDPEARFSGDNPKGPGRPPGQPNHEYDLADHEAPRCRKCAGTHLRVLKRLPDRSHCGTIDGRPYTRIEFRRTQCTDCRSVQILRTYVHTPNHGRK
jgi:hypothetical protein